MWMVWKKKGNGVTTAKTVFSDGVRKPLRKWDLCLFQSEWNLSFCTIVLSRYLWNPCSKTTCDSVSTNIAWLASESVTILARQFSTIVAFIFTSPWLFLFPGTFLWGYLNMGSPRLQFLRPQINFLFAASFIITFLVNTLYYALYKFNINMILWSPKWESVEKMWLFNWKAPGNIVGFDCGWWLYILFFFDCVGIFLLRLFLRAVLGSQRNWERYRLFPYTSPAQWLWILTTGKSTGWFLWLNDCRTKTKAAFEIKVSHTRGSRFRKPENSLVVII